MSSPFLRYAGANAVRMIYCALSPTTRDQDQKDALARDLEGNAVAASVRAGCLSGLVAAAITLFVIAAFALPFNLTRLRESFGGVEHE